MTIPALLFGFVLSTLYGAAFHFWRGGGAGRLLLYLILGWLGFWTGQFIGDRLGWSFASLGPLNLGMATLGSFLFLGAGYWLSLVEPDKQKK
jgi:uncharacterized membrane protein YeaQ/YmgE (transglycosylase-associated protein family)